MTRSTWRLVAIVSIAAWSCCLVVIGALVNAGFGQNEVYRDALMDCRGTIDRQLELMKAGASSLSSAANALDTASKLNYFLDQGVRMQLAAEVLEGTDVGIAVAPDCMGQ